MAPIPFQGNAAALSSDGLAQVSASLGVYAPEIWTVLAVETSGCGYLPDRRPQILFERHIFHRLTNGQYDDGDISDPSPGGYGPRGAQQYESASHRQRSRRSTAERVVGDRANYGHELCPCRLRKRGRYGGRHVGFGRPTVVSHGSFSPPHGTCRIASGSRLGVVCARL